MNEHELERFAQELRRVTPASPPRELMARLKSEVEVCRQSKGSAVEQTTARGKFARLVSTCVSALALREGLRNRTPQVWRQSTAAWFSFRKYPRITGATACLAVAMAAFALWRAHDGSNRNLDALTASSAPLTADDVQIDHELVSSFDTIARLPGGEPVRFRCEKWMDQTVVRDRARGLVIEQRTPRVEVVPVRFETY